LANGPDFDRPACCPHCTPSSSTAPGSRNARRCLQTWPTLSTPCTQRSTVRGSHRRKGGRRRRGTPALLTAALHRGDVRPPLPSPSVLGLPYCGAVVLRSPGNLAQSYGATPASEVSVACTNLLVLGCCFRMRRCFFCEEPPYQPRGPQQHKRAWHSRHTNPGTPTQAPCPPGLCYLGAHTADPDLAPRFNDGLVLKHNANQRYATNSVSAALFREVGGGLQARQVGLVLGDWTGGGPCPRWLQDPSPA